MPPSTLRRAVAIVALGLSLGGCRSDHEKMLEHLGNAKTYQEQGRPREALLELRNALKLEPRNADTNYAIANALVAQQDYANAIFYLRETQRLDPTRTDATLDEAKLVMGGDPTRALELVSAVLEREPGNPMAHLRRMEVALHQGNTQEALAAAMTAVELAPNDPLYPMQIGIVRQAQIREARLAKKTPPDELFEQALAAFRKSDELYGGNHVVRANIGRTYLFWGEHPDEARAAFRSAIEIANQKGSAGERREAAAVGLDYARIAKDSEFGIYALEQLVAADDSNLDAWADLATAREQKDGSGDTVWKDLLGKRPSDLDAHWRRAAWLFQNGRGEEAEQGLAALAAKGEERARALELLAGVQLQLAKRDEALATIAALEKEFPKDPSTQLARARLATVESRYVDAAPLLRDLVQKRESAEAYRMLALAEFQLGNLPSAVAAADRSLALSGGRAPETAMLKARIHHASRDWTLAAQTWFQLLQAGVELPPRDLVLLASALYEGGRPIVARQVLEGALALPEPPILGSIEFAAREGAKSPDAARKHLETALSRAPRHGGLIAAITRLDVSNGRAREARERLDAIIDGGEPPAAALLARARLLAADRRYEEAEKDINRLFEVAPNLPGALELLLQIYAAQDKLDLAVASLEEADRTGALSPGARLLLARIYLSRGETSKTRDTLERALAERPDLAGAKNDLAYLLAQEGSNLERALTLAQEAQRALSTDPNAADTLAYVYLRKGLLEPALQQSRYAIQLAEESGQPVQAAYQHHLGLVLRALGRNAEAASAFERALDLDPNFSEAAEARRELEAARTAAKSAPSAS
jgi:tetratricopeptide (TPR) repeat protein